ncbi:MAG: hypothetical protein ACREB9_02720 [Thermoplasmata archaeon]
MPNPSLPTSARPFLLSCGAHLGRAARAVLPGSGPYYGTHGELYRVSTDSTAYCYYCESRAAWRIERPRGELPEQAP